MTEQLSRTLRYRASEAAERFSLPVALILAIIRVESEGGVFAWRVEPPYRWLWDVAHDRPFRTLTPSERTSEHAPEDFNRYLFSSRDTEWWGQQASWGPMQVMGGVAREHGFDEPFPMLCSSGPGVTMGAKALADFRRRFFDSSGWEGVAAAYNAGSPRRAASGRWENQHYVDKVRRAGGFHETG